MPLVILPLSFISVPITVEALAYSSIWRMLESIKIIQ